MHSALELEQRGTKWVSLDEACCQGQRPALWMRCPVGQQPGRRRRLHLPTLRNFILSFSTSIEYKDRSLTPIHFYTPSAAEKLLKTGRIKSFHELKLRIFSEFSWWKYFSVFILRNISVQFLSHYFLRLPRAPLLWLGALDKSRSQQNDTISLASPTRHLRN